ncbi:LPXTG cell wall anchor domain-containing protein [Cellulomonas sp. JZ18]|uniref:LPXTG cell wall anchor domain-containing protein n=1 Tax=Cellulomonas sp. JZ18 TaxID=2654191 RepID=UPI001E65932D|nr:LPXTG cell wall anchor domain-containing protein [Cellulomonas sp. JZ18]
MAGRRRRAGREGVDWPGWRLENGTWVEGDEYDWVRPEVTVRFDVNPSSTVTVAYPPSSPQCLTSPPRTEVLAAADEPAERSEVLAVTGTQAGLLAAAAAALVALGAGAVALRRRRHG